MAFSREIARITHDGGVTAVAFSPDGQSLATASRDKTARFWSTALDDMLHQLCTGHGAIYRSTNDADTPTPPMATNMREHAGLLQSQTQAGVDIFLSALTNHLPTTQKSKD